jgi:hypothetical protein
MAYSLSGAMTISVSDGSGGSQTMTFDLSAFVPTEPAFCGAGTATTTPTAIALGNIAAPKLVMLINDGAQEITVALGSGSITLGTLASTTNPRAAVFPTPSATPQVSTASSTSAYRTFISE